MLSSVGVGWPLLRVLFPRNNSESKSSRRGFSKMISSNARCLSTSLRQRLANRLGLRAGLLTKGVSSKSLCLEYFWENSSSVSHAVDFLGYCFAKSEDSSEWESLQGDWAGPEACGFGKNRHRRSASSVRSSSLVVLVVTSKHRALGKPLNISSLDEDMRSLIGDDISKFFGNFENEKA